MATLKELRQRQKTVTVISRMTAAMKMISQAKFNRVQGQLRSSIESCEELKALAGRVLFTLNQNHKIPTSRYLKEGPKDAPWLFIFVTSDSGFCGGFNQSLVKAALSFIKEKGVENCEIICVGKKGVAPLEKSLNPKIIQIFSHAADDLVPLKELVVSHFLKGRIRGCSLLYSRFFNILKQEPTVVQLLPMVLLDHQEGDLVDTGLITYEPFPEDVLDEILYLLIDFSLHALLKEHALSEHAARMAAMDSATQNANSMIQEIKLTYNHLRQALITKELIEIISGAESLK
jgi:F-type H+-transporting ATPase subunit gamma